MAVSEVPMRMRADREPALLRRSCQAARAPKSNRRKTAPVILKSPLRRTSARASLTRQQQHLRRFSDARSIPTRDVAPTRPV